MKDMLLQEKLLGNLGRWEEAINNKKVVNKRSVNGRESLRNIPKSRVK
jgi:hypothetical protein